MLKPKTKAERISKNVLLCGFLLCSFRQGENPNIPLRDLFYVSDVYSALTREDFLYGGIPVKIPEPIRTCRVGAGNSSA